MIKVWPEGANYYVRLCSCSLLGKGDAYVEVRESPSRRYWSLGAMGTGAGPDSRVVGGVVGGGGGVGGIPRPGPFWGMGKSKNT